ncbi:unnamed protein product [Paramecium primaurelia]|uniref:Uncharacterized protein n=2 Tax=Paramecium TaxID=5884 RepID=A0A8S1XV50_9CILI|nr:unnamed protein product [Paramecium primaurelia]CAD8205436.1 unnamed protein product [Paramecium pentaurelia]
MKQRYQNENYHSNIYTHRSERSSSSNILQDLTNNRQLLFTKKPIRGNRQPKQDLLLNEHDIQLQQNRLYKQKKIQQLKIQLQTLKQNYDKQAISQFNLHKTIDNTVKKLLELKTQININHIEEPWQDIIKMEKDISGNEENIIKQMPIQNFNEVISGHQLTILELVSQQQNLQQQNYWIAQMKLLHETFIQKNLTIGQILKPKEIPENLEQSIEISYEEFTQSFGKKC